MHGEGKGGAYTSSFPGPGAYNRDKKKPSAMQKTTLHYPHRMS